jgi:hypothetical protein
MIGIRQSDQHGESLWVRLPALLCDTHEYLAGVMLWGEAGRSHSQERKADVESGRARRKGRGALWIGG